MGVQGICGQVRRIMKVKRRSSAPRGDLMGKSQKEEKGGEGVNELVISKEMKRKDVTERWSRPIICRHPSNTIIDERNSRIFYNRPGDCLLVRIFSLSFSTADYEVLSTGQEWEAIDFKIETLNISTGWFLVFSSRPKMCSENTDFKIKLAGPTPTGGIANKRGTLKRRGDEQFFFRGEISYGYGAGMNVPNGEETASTGGS